MSKAAHSGGFSDSILSFVESAVIAPQAVEVLALCVALDGENEKSNITVGGKTQETAFISAGEVETRVLYVGDIIDDDLLPFRAPHSADDADAAEKKDTQQRGCGAEEEAAFLFHEMDLLR